MNAMIRKELVWLIVSMTYATQTIKMIICININKSWTINYDWNTQACIITAIYN